MRIKTNARCPECIDSLGRPTEIVEYKSEEYTEYNCTSCDVKWLREH